MNLYLNVNAQLKWNDIITDFFSKQNSSQPIAQPIVTTSNYGIDGPVKELDALLSDKHIDVTSSHMAIAHTYVHLNSQYLDAIVILYKDQHSTKLVTQTITPPAIAFEVRSALLEIFHM